jgi:hypothetical protein
MAISREPKPRPSELDYVPPNSRPYKVTPNDSWWTLADRSDVKFSGMGALDLCYFNFKTRKPPEINWYLRHKVGCQRETRDGNNYMFSAADTPGIVYLPKEGHLPPVGETQKKRTKRLNTWVGLVAKGGTQFAVIGIETVTGLAFSLDDPSDWMMVTASVNRLGPGWGASGGVAAVYIVGVNSPSQLNGHQQMEDLDFNLTLGTNLGKALKTGSKASEMQPLIDRIRKLGAKTPAAFKKRVKADPDTYTDFVKLARQLNDVLGVGEASEPKVIMVDIPFGSAGFEASVFKALSNFNAVWDNT